MKGFYQNLDENQTVTSCALGYLSTKKQIVTNFITIHFMGNIMLGNIFSDEEANTRIELPASFILTHQKQLDISIVYNNSSEAWRYYSYHISRFPQDLRAHAQRLFLGINANMTDFLAGAIQDLFISLGKSGSPLKKKMLDLVKSKLNNIDIAHFEIWLSTGNRKDYSYRLGSVLDSGLSGKSQKLVTVEQSQETSSYGSVIEEAYACLEYGQVEEAQKLLESELQRDVNNADIAQELLNIYQYTRDKESLDSITAQLADSDVILSDAWKKAQKESQEW